MFGQQIEVKLELNPVFKFNNLILRKMKKKINTISFGMILTILLFSCDRKQDLSDVQVLKQKIHASQDFKNYKYAVLELTESTVRGEISTNGVDLKAMDQELSKVKSVEEYSKKLDDKGVKGSKKLAELLFLQNQSVRNIMKSNPELKKLNRSEIIEIMELNLKPDLTKNKLNIKL